MQKPKQEKVDAIVRVHEAWLKEVPAGGFAASTWLRAYFDYMDLTGLNLSGCNLSRACFVGCKLDGTNFANSILTGAVFDYATGTNVEGSGTNISEATFVGARVNWSEKPNVQPDTSNFGLELQRLLDKHGLKLGAPLSVVPK
jgi:uncharacterized protein YjbI with pentapeptide repeats